MPQTKPSWVPGCTTAGISACGARTSPYHKHASSWRSLLKMETWPHHVVLFSVSPPASHTKCLKSLLVLLHAQALPERLSLRTCFATEMQKDLRCLLQPPWDLIWTLQNTIARDDLFVENTQNSFEGQIDVIWYSLKHPETCTLHATRLLFPPSLLSQRNWTKCYTINTCQKENVNRHSWNLIRRGLFRQSSLLYSCLTGEFVE